MEFYWIKTPLLIKRWFSNQIWDIPNLEYKIYLTFDDGPTPEITNWVLDVLKKHQIKATFFCIGKNINAFPSIFKNIADAGHSTGNHTFNHVNGWKTKSEDYVQNISLCSDAVEKQNVKTTNLFRPPYGKLKAAQSKKLEELGYKIIMWDVLSADFDTTITPEKCLENVVKNVKSGSIIVFHDSVKAFKNLEYALPKIIEILKERNFVFEVIT